MIDLREIYKETVNDVIKNTMILSYTNHSKQRKRLLNKRKHIIRKLKILRLVLTSKYGRN